MTHDFLKSSLESLGFRVRILVMARMDFNVCSSSTVCM